ncbi:hypothetical protein TNCT_159771 [Trichonephila clavata]|uniref:Uncharacterized protein n=1 Tax=Trichonephila clavata TaxID=2740835 RepID=A0A8X6FKT8_TRICU|nr:hypothetical protein TNCT_159771 [Trichonephila clavata]
MCPLEVEINFFTPQGHVRSTVIRLKKLISNERRCGLSLLSSSWVGRIMSGKQCIMFSKYFSDGVVRIACLSKNCRHAAALKLSCLCVNSRLDGINKYRCDTFTASSRLNS